MADTENLLTASLYINNQLLSRGLLRDGKTIDFANAGKGGEESAVTAGRIISIVNDLILRRDRDAEHRESLATAMRGLRAENLRHVNDIARLTEKQAEERRRAEIASAAEAALKTQLKSADATARGLREEIARMKALVSQTRTTCATEVRRRDRQIDTLKKQFGEAGRSRGSRANPAVTTIHVTGCIDPDRDSPTRSTSTATADYDLRSETNAFLAKLARNLSEENETILGVVHGAMDQLRGMSGYQGEDRQGIEVARRPSCEELAADLNSVMDHMRNILTNPSFVPIEEVMVREEEISRLRSGWVKMENRWKETVHLMDGWRKRMAASGRPVCDEDLKMGLRLSPVRVKDVEETSQAPGMGLPAVAEEDEEEGRPSLRSPCPPSQDCLDLVPEPNHDDSDGRDAIDDESFVYEDHVPRENSDVEDAGVSVSQRHSQSSPDSSPLPEAPQLSPLRNSASAGNRVPLQSGKQRPMSGRVATTVGEDARDLGAQSKSMRSLPVRPKVLAAQTRLPSKAHKSKEQARSPSRTSLDDALLPDADPEPVEKAETRKSEGISQEAGEARHDGDKAAVPGHDKPCHLMPRPALPRNAPPAPQQSPLTMSTIAAKLAASAREADAARVRAKLKAARSARDGGLRRAISSGAGPGEAKPVAAAAPACDSGLAPRDVDPIKQDLAPHEEQPRPEKRKRDRKTSKAASRRRSTLSPWELEALISGNATP